MNSGITYTALFFFEKEDGSSPSPNIRIYS